MLRNQTVIQCLKPILAWISDTSCTLLIPACLEIAAPAVGPNPLTTLTTPFGNPASLARLATYRALRGVCSAAKIKIILENLSV